MRSSAGDVEGKQTRRQKGLRDPWIFEVDMVYVLEKHANGFWKMATQRRKIY